MRTSSLVQRWLRIAGTITWSVIGVTFLVFFRGASAGLGGCGWLAWCAAFATFLLLFWRGTAPDVAERPRRRRLASLVLQATCAFLIAGLPSKPVGFIFLTLVAAQMPGLLPTWATAAWIVLQTAVMGWVYALIVPAWEAEAYVAVYLGFQAFAYMVVRAAQSEAAARFDLAATHQQLRDKDALLAASQRLAERVRIGHDLHDALGLHLTAMCLNLEVAAHLTVGRARTHIEQAQGLARKLLDDVRAVVSELRGASGDLSPALASMAAALPRRRSTSTSERTRAPWPIRSGRSRCCAARRS
ncbi:MAG TPA: histidine kinase [Planctomycetota bacterium]|nr:histidine kinase [Planctomycetota bacterium]